MAQTKHLSDGAENFTGKLARMFRRCRVRMKTLDKIYALKFEEGKKERNGAI
jgi:hypothetical protein